MMTKQFLYGYIKFNAKIRVLTGLRIGGKETIKIAEVDQVVIKDPITELPYIPGSSLKGKLRSLVEKINNKIGPTGEPFGVSKNELAQKIQGENKDIQQILVTEDDYFVIRIFGNHKGDIGLEPRLIIRDFLCMEDNTNKIYEIKVENVINRISGTAEHPREIQRVRKGIEFKGEIIYKLLGWEILEKQEVLKQAKKELEKLKQAIIYLVKYDYLGGSGTRGYGKIALWFDKIEIWEYGKNEPIILNIAEIKGYKNVENIENFRDLKEYLKQFALDIRSVAVQEASEYGEQI